ncbi:MAG: hypothetical protein LQ351_002738 [Letrouitia transgressa]|nr:MAG: hypothetical protein LQ351_002738 [Letrouitia transgressa]
MGKYTGIEILLNSHLAPTAIRSKLTPQLATLIPMIEEEMRRAFEVEYPSSKEAWTEIDLQKRALGVVSRVTARLFVGFPLCRDEKWLELNSQIVEQLFITVMVMRNFPPWVHPVLNKILPSQYKLKRILRQIHSMLLPVIEERRRNPPPSDQKPIDVLEYMMDLAKGTEAEAQNLAMRYCYTIIGSVHTVTGAIIDSVYEVCARPEYAEPLRHEIQQALDEEGGWNKTTLSKLRKVDSFMKEVQRMYPPSAIGFRRMVKEPLTFSDGLHIPAGTFVCVVVAPQNQGDDDDQDKASFDGYRYYRKRLQNPDSTRNDYTATDADHLTFSHGRYACPGRHIASAEIKMALAHLLLKYDFKFPEGKGRPANLNLHELSFPDPAGRIMLKQRPGQADVL